MVFNLLSEERTCTEAVQITHSSVCLWLLENTSSRNDSISLGAAVRRGSCAWFEASPSSRHVTGGRALKSLRGSGNNAAASPSAQVLARGPHALTL